MFLMSKLADATIKSKVTDGSTYTYSTISDKRGRVMSFLTLALFGTAPFGSLLMGFMAERLSLHITFLINGIISLIGAYFFINKASFINAQIIEHVQRTEKFI